MAAKARTFLFLLLAALFSAAAAHNITRILSQHPIFSTFNSLLSSAGLAGEINSRRTITVLAVADAAIGDFAGFDAAAQRRILSVHVILDYFDLEKLQNLRSPSTILATLFQASGKADGLTGFLNVTKFAGGRVSFGSAASGEGRAADLVGPIATRPYNISVLHVSSMIVPPGFDDLNQNHTSPSPPPPPVAGGKAHAPTKGKAKAKAPAPAPAAEAPAIEDEPPAADAPVAPSDAPAADSSEAESPKGTADEEVKSGADRVAVGAIALVLSWVCF